MDTEIYRTNVTEEYVVQQQVSVKNVWIDYGFFETQGEAIAAANSLASVKTVYRVVRRTK